MIREACKTCGDKNFCDFADNDNPESFFVNPARCYHRLPTKLEDTNLNHHLKRLEDTIKRLEYNLEQSDGHIQNLNIQLKACAADEWTEGSDLPEDDRLYLVQAECGKISVVYWDNRYGNNMLYSDGEVYIKTIRRYAVINRDRVEEAKSNPIKMKLVKDIIEAHKQNVKIFVDDDQE